MALRRPRCESPQVRPAALGRSGCLANPADPADPADIARIAVDGIAADAYEILADNAARQAQAALSGGVSVLYPQLP